MSSKRCFFALALLGAVALGPVGSTACGNDPTETRPGPGGAGGEGPGPGAATAVTATSTGPTTSTGTGAGGGPLGAPCSDDGECGAGLFCVRATDTDAIFGGAPANGYCTKTCKESSDCPEADDFCLRGEGKTSICVRGCEIGPEEIDLEHDPDKCVGREDVRCQYSGDGRAFCVPSCGSDAQCPGGLACDPALTVCVEKPRQGKALGEPCDPDASKPGCAGLCVNFGGGVGMCSSGCVLGGPVDPSHDCGGLERGHCALPPALPGDQASGTGDMAFCAPACHAHEDCAVPDTWCAKLDPKMTGGPVENGYCLGAAECETEPCKSGKACTDTPLGKRCLDPSFLPPDAGAGGSGGSGGMAGAGGSGGSGGSGGMAGGAQG